MKWPNKINNSHKIKPHIKTHYYEISELQESREDSREIAWVNKPQEMIRGEADIWLFNSNTRCWKEMEHLEKIFLYLYI